MPRGGARPKSGPAKGTKYRTQRQLIGQVAPPPPPAMVAELRALDEMRFGAKVLRNMLVESLRAKDEGKATKAEVAAAAKDYIKAQAEITPYEDRRLASITVGGDADNPIRTVQQYDFSKLSDEQLEAVLPILRLLTPVADKDAPSTTH